MTEIGVTVRAILRYIHLTQRNGSEVRLNDLEKEIRKLYSSSILLDSKFTPIYTITPPNSYLIYKKSIGNGVKYNLYLIIQNNKIVDVVK